MSEQDSERGQGARPASPAEEAPQKPPGPRQRRTSLSMHDGVPDWCDCCSCEAEPYWVEAAERLGIDLDDAAGAE
jgi:hypothetical protein